MLIYSRYLYKFFTLNYYALIIMRVYDQINTALFKKKDVGIEYVDVGGSEEELFRRFLFIS